MTRDMDSIIFDSRYEVEDVLNILSDFVSSHHCDDKIDTALELVKLLNLIYCEW